MNDPELTDRGFLAHVNMRAGMEAYSMAKDFMARAEIPNPLSAYDASSADPARASEFFEGPRVIRAYFNGLSLSVVHNEIPVGKKISRWLKSKITGETGVYKSPAFQACEIKDRRILAPLLQVALGENAYLEIVPGIERAKIDAKGLSETVQELASRNIRFVEPQAEFIGQIGEEGYKALLLSNRRMVEAMPAYDFSVSEECPLQERVFGNLSRWFQSAHESGNGRDLQEVFAYSRTNTNLPKGHPEKILHAYWKEDRHKSVRLSTIANAAEALELKLNPA